jgi:ribonuclease HI
MEHTVKDKIVYLDGSGKKGSDLGRSPKKGWEGPGVCYLCKHDSEDIDHLLIHCTFTKIVWARLTSIFKLKRNWDGASINDCFTIWTKDKSVSKGLAALTCWHIWLERNKAIFEERSPSFSAVVYKILGSHSWLPQSLKPASIRVCTITQQEGYSIACFDGAAISGGKCCGAGGIINLPGSTVYKWYINCGEGTNTKAELLGVWATLTLANMWSIQKIQILGDSKVIIDWLNQKSNLQAIDIEGWKQKTRDLANLFQGISFHHIYRDFNKEADLLSKQALLEPEGRLSFYQWVDGAGGPLTHLNIFEISSG